MNFISEISEGSWLGEKIPATLGKPGKNVLGQVVAAVPDEIILSNMIQNRPMKWKKTEK